MLGRRESGLAGLKEEALVAFREALDVEVFPISAVVGRGLEPLGEMIWQRVQEHLAREQEPQPDE